MREGGRMKSMHLEDAMERLPFKLIDDVEYLEFYVVKDFIREILSGKYKTDEPNSVK